MALRGGHYDCFGYEDGAFTGAKKRGSVGKNVQAEGGTLFLDEIGDMPIAQQLRLMRVLQDRTVAPLGSTRAILRNQTARGRGIMSSGSNQPPKYQKIEVRKGQVTEKMSRAEFRERYMARFYDPAFRAEDGSLDRIEAIAWDAYSNARKSPITEKAGVGFSDPEYDLSVEWRAASDRIKAAQARQQDRRTPSRVLVINASSRNDYTCPGEMSKSYRLGKLVQQTLERRSCDVDFLDLSRLNSDHDLHIHPCKGCVSTAMPLCHWPCSCYPNHSLGLVNDWMNEIYERFAACHGVLFVTPVYWYQVSSPLKLLMDRLVCADGGNPDPTSTHGKKPEEAKRIELAGWEYPKHLAGRAYGVVVHGDVAGIEGSRRALTDWLNWMGFIESGAKSRLDRFIGYYEPYATSHDTLDRDNDMQKEVINVAEAVAICVDQLRNGHKQPDDNLEPVRAK